MMYIAAMDLLEGQSLNKSFAGRDILNNVNIAIPQGVATAIAGVTGSGKSTLLKMLAGLLEPDGGKVYFDGQRIEGPLTKLIPGHDRIAYLSQYFELRNHYRVEEIFDYSNKGDSQYVNNLAELCNVAHLLKRRTDELSGGERQRIALARVLLTMPRVLLLDEPFSNLDLQQKNALKQAIGEVTDALQLTTVLVSHDAADILPWATNIHVLQDGGIVQSGTPATIYYQPVNVHVAGLFGHYHVIDPELRNIFAATGLHLDENIHFLRPEILAIDSSGSTSLRGMVEAARFMGPYWQIEVRAGQHLLLCHHHGQVPGIGSKVSIMPASAAYIHTHLY